jgi:hypothetical protein
MIEIPRAALTADEIAEVAEFFSFGTNDLTQMTFGYSAATTSAASCPTTSRSGDPPSIPFQTLDQTGVGRAGRARRREGPQTNAPTSRSASAASTAANRRSRLLPQASGSTTSAARPSACRSPASRRRRPVAPLLVHRWARESRAPLSTWIRAPADVTVTSDAGATRDGCRAAAGRPPGEGRPKLFQRCPAPARATGRTRWRRLPERCDPADKQGGEPERRRDERRTRRQAGSTETQCPATFWSVIVAVTGDPAREP